MSASDEFGVLAKAFTGLGIDESSLISILGKLHPEQKQSFRKGTRHFFTEDDRLFERWDERHIAQLQQDVLYEIVLLLKEDNNNGVGIECSYCGFVCHDQNAMVLWTMHPWERDARLAKEALKKGQQTYGVLVEIACTRSSEELLGARRAYHSLFDHSIEEDVAVHVHGIERNLLVALVSSYRYEGPRVHEETARSEAKILHNAFKAADKKPIEDEEVVRILTTRSKLHIKAISTHYEEISSSDITEDLATELLLKQTLQCLCTPETYFSTVLDSALKDGADETTREALTRVIVTEANNVDMKKIKEEYHQKYGVDLSEKISDVANGNYRDFLLTLVARGA
ncbi:hypothetical protein RJ639_036915 [Escallonia herrerae]|uniref:Annexin n=1 Tax=Escallonia herrerae TaxID=1293975 RepID=A0AA89BI73_9ASTE|nr:hypothetical protein RJ639_036915 [Escallonia herrerae]